MFDQMTKHARMAAVEAVELLSTLLLNEDPAVPDRLDRATRARNAVITAHKIVVRVAQTNQSEANRRGVEELGSLERTANILYDMIVSGR